MLRKVAPTLTLLVLLTACGADPVGDGSAEPDAGAKETNTITSTEYQAFRGQPVACDGTLPEAAQEMAFDGPDDLGLTGSVVATIVTSCGDVTIELDADTAPVTVNSFVFLAEQGYFDGTVSHRIVPGFVIQIGDPTATGRGGPGYSIPDELPATGFIYERGTVAMANAGPNTGGSQFFLVLEDVPLPPDFSVFGRVTAGLATMDRIALIPTTARAAGLEPSSPLETIYIETVEIDR